MRGRTGGTTRKLRRIVRARERVCYQCGQAIDWTIPYLDPHTGTVNPDAGTLEHKLPLSRHPELAEDPGNMAASHSACNNAAGADGGARPIGQRSRAW